MHENMAHFEGNPAVIHNWILRKGRPTYKLRRVQSLATLEALHFIKEASKTSETGSLPGGERAEPELIEQRQHLIAKRRRTYVRACAIDKGSTDYFSTARSSAIANLFWNSPNPAPANFMECALAECAVPSKQCRKGFKNCFQQYQE